MHKQTYQWRLFGNSEDAVVRYCSHCGSKAVFRDSGKRRQNANGKNLYDYAIYKCDRDHTWNRNLKTTHGEAENDAGAVKKESILACGNEIIDLSREIDRGIDEIEIVLEEVTGKWRLDKLLGDKITDTSRSAICKMIQTGAIRVDGRLVKPGFSLRKQQVITIHAENAFDGSP